MQKTTRLHAVVLALILIAPMLLAACGKSVGETIDDATITARVKTSLINDPVVGAARIDGDQRHQNQVEEPDGDARGGAALGLADAVTIRSQAGVARVTAELHAATAVVGDRG
jgi:hypothetical protein